MRVGWVTFILLALAAAPAATQTDEATWVLGGFVRAAGGTPLPAAEIVVRGTRVRVISDEAGRFELTGLRPGRYDVEVTRLGYRPAHLRVEVRSGVRALEVVLTPSPLALPGVQVTATPGSRDAFRVAQPTLQLEGAALERNLGGSLAATLGGQPGLEVRYNGPAAALPVLRGLTGDRVLVLQDGQRVGDLSGSADDHGLTLDPLSAQRVEVVRGPASLLYGTNALGGVVHVISADAPSRVPPHARFSALLQTESATPGGTAAARAVVPVGSDWALSLRGGMRSTSDVRIPRDDVFGTRLPNTQHRNGGVALGVGHMGPAVAGGFSMQAHVMEHGVPLPADAGEDVLLRGRRVAASGRLELGGGVEGGRVRIQGTFSSYEHDELVNGLPAMAFGLRTGGADLLVRQARRGRLAGGAWGASGLVRRYAATGEDQLTAPADAQSWGVFTFQELALGRDAALQAGLRLDRNSITSRDDPHFGPGARREFTAVSGAAGVTFPLAEALSGAIHVARSFRVPAVEELFSNALHIGTASYEIGDPRLQPEVATGVDAVLRARSRTVHAELAGWVNTIHNFVHLEARGDTVLDGVRWPVLAHVQDRARLAGAEASLTWHVAPAWLVTLQGDAVHGRLRGDRAVPFLPATRVAGSVRRDDGRSEVGVGVRHAFAQGRVAAGETAAGAYTLLDAHATLRLGDGHRGHAIVFRAENVLDIAYRTAASRIKDFAPNPGRNLSLLYRVGF